MGLVLGGGEYRTKDQILNTTAEEREKLVEAEGFAAIRRYLDVQTDAEAMSSLVRCIGRRYRRS